MFRRWLEAFEEFAVDVILDRRSGKRASLLKIFLQALSWLFHSIVQTRIWLYRTRLLHEANTGVMVISIGNLTVGGTGKTPVVEMFARSLRDRGRNVAILSRGYKAKRPPLLRRLQRKWLGMERKKPRIVHDGHRLLLDSRYAGDEPYMLAKSLGDVVVLTDKDRVRAAHHAVRYMRCDTLLLDDGMQYLPLRHRLEVCLIDSQAPFGNDHMLPRGILREPPANLHRANFIFVTKCHSGENDALVARIRQYNRTAPIVECTHHALYLQNLYTGERKPLSELQGKYIGAISGIARPESFEESLESLGANLQIVKRFTDHHRFTDLELREFMNRCVRRDLDLVVTTEKDSVRFPYRMETLEIPIYFLRVEIQILRGHAHWEQLLNYLVNGPAKAPARERETLQKQSS